MRTALCIWLALLLSACGTTTKLIDRPEPIPDGAAIAIAQDARVAAALDYVVVRNGPGSWARNATWDEYLIRFRNGSASPVRILDVALVDALGARLAGGIARGPLAEQSVATERRYRDQGTTLRVGSGRPGAVAGAIMGGSVAVGAASAAGAASGAGMMAGAAAAAALSVAIVGGGVVVGGYFVYRYVNHNEVDAEIQRRRSAFPITVNPDEETRIDLFFPYAPGPRRVEIAYEQATVSHELQIDTTETLSQLHLGPAPLPGTDWSPLQRDLAAVMEDGRGELAYRYQDLNTSKRPQYVRLEHFDATTGVHSFADGSGYMRLGKLVRHAGLTFDPPIALSAGNMRVGNTWTHSGKAVGAKNTYDVASDARVAAVEDRETDAGRIETFRVDERRGIGGASFYLTHWVDVRTLALVATEARPAGRNVGRVDSTDAPSYHYRWELAWIRPP